MSLIRFQGLFVGSSGVAVSEVANSLELPSSSDVSEIIKVVVQIVIAVATLFGLFKKKPKNSESTIKN